MAQRRWQIPPDQAMETPSGPIAVVSQDALLKAIIDGAILLDRAGGCLSVVVRRYPGAIDGEMVTVGGVVEWKDRTDARPAAEKVSEPQRLQESAPEDERVLASVIAHTDAPEPEVQVDESDVPEHLRA